MSRALFASPNRPAQPAPFTRSGEMPTGKASRRYVLTLRSEGRADVPEEVRLRKLLKVALRSFAFRAISIQELTDGGAHALPAHEPRQE